MKKLVIFALIGGFVITLITGLTNTTPFDLDGTTWYGWPLAWRIVPVVPDPVASYNIAKFVGDFIIWFVLVFAVLFLWQKFKK